MHLGGSVSTFQNITNQVFSDSIPNMRKPEEKAVLLAC